MSHVKGLLLGRTDEKESLQHLRIIHTDIALEQPTEELELRHGL